MIERPAAGERAVIVQLDFGQLDIEDQLEEVRLLTESAGGTVVAEVRGRRHSPDPKTYAGKGKVDGGAPGLAHVLEQFEFRVALIPGAGVRLRGIRVIGLREPFRKLGDALLDVLEGKATIPDVLLRTGIEKLTFKWTAGLLYGYLGEYKKRVPLNYNGFSPAVNVALAYQFTPTWGGQVLLGGSFLMFMINMRIP